ncbi:MAG: AAA family ATPase [Acetobacteraceae bacterium]|nr:AAA family ATPase [Acetobacteraceae bacterium]
MGIVITVAQQKGGTGKTTIAANIAAAMAGNGRVAMLDIDPQKTLIRWYGLRGNRTPALSCSDVSGWRMTAELERLRSNHDVVVIDSPPRIDTDARIAIRAANIVLIPVQPSPPDLWAAEGTLKLAAEERRPARIILNRVPATSRLRRMMEADIVAKGLPAMRAALGNRSGFALAFASGLGVTEASPRSTATAEVRGLVSELQELG